MSSQPVPPNHGLQMIAQGVPGFVQSMSTAHVATLESDLRVVPSNFFTSTISGFGPNAATISPRTEITMNIPMNTQMPFLVPLMNGSGSMVPIPCGSRILSGEMSPASQGYFSAPFTPHQNAAEPSQLSVMTGDIEQEVYLELQLSKRRPTNADYVCVRCERRGHYVADCPLGDPILLTPYQGPQRSRGDFKCGNCRNKWSSNWTVANQPQECHRCHHSVRPRKMYKLEH